MRPLHPLRAAGFTLLEMMVVVAIVGILTALGVSAFNDASARGATQNAAADFSAALSAAKARAVERGTNVVVIIYPTFKKATNALTGGNGAYFIYEDADGDFMTEGSSPAGGDQSFASFAPSTGAIRPTGSSKDRYIDAVYLDSYPRSNARFLLSGSTTPSWSAPFADVGSAANANGCSFCTTGTSARGAIVFSPERQARFFKGDGTQDSGRVEGIVFQSPVDVTNLHQFGLVGATAHVSYLRLP